ncbi:hypothetical protein BDW02DRAFT_595371 [Decorospora gaudefroyi]|uniref:Uncharacterized protein n=1 Tax=Decorospora gaudefroyi TaxID=184978 RepID=A0A6A5KP17_9PLEO|nr:hypothetical protein BDW02DRAFT_595371 [Decorospora gaudefroyi]
MKASVLLATASTLLSTAFAAPTGTNPLKYTLQLANDQTGKNHNVDIYVNYGGFSFGELWGDSFGTPVIATSLQAVTPGVGGGNVRCGVYGGRNFWELNAQRTYIDLDADPNKLVQTDVTNYYIYCWATFPIPRV